MQKVSKMLTVLGLSVAVAATTALTAPDKADARPQYLIQFAKKYENLKEKAKETKCDICHIPKKKKDKHNHYGEALEELFDGKENVKDKKEIIKVLEKGEKKKSAIEGKTFGDLIEEGKLPASKE